MNKELLKGNTDMLILASLEERPLHGYALTRMLTQGSNSAFKFSAGMLYPVLHKLEERGLIAGSWEQKDEKRLRKCYRLTPKGKKQLSARKEDWFRFSTFISGVLHG